MPEWVHKTVGFEALVVLSLTTSKGLAQDQLSPLYT